MHVWHIMSILGYVIWYENNVIRACSFEIVLSGLICHVWRKKAMWLELCFCLYPSFLCMIFFLTFKDNQRSVIGMHVLPILPLFILLFSCIKSIWLGYWCLDCSLVISFFIICLVILCFLCFIAGDEANALICSFSAAVLS